MRPRTKRRFGEVVGRPRAGGERRTQIARFAYAELPRRACPSSFVSRKAAPAAIGSTPPTSLRLQMPEVRRVDRDLGCEDDLLFVHDGLRVVRLAGRGALRRITLASGSERLITPSGSPGAMNGLLLPRSTLPFVSRAVARQRS